MLAGGAATAGGLPVPDRAELPPFVSARLDAQGRLVAKPDDSETYILKALDQGDWYRRLLAFPAPHSVAISTRTMRIGGSWGAKGSAEEALRACGGAASGCRVYLDRDRVAWMPQRTDPVPLAVVPRPASRADTATLEGALTGADTDQPSCESTPDAVWAEAEGYRGCLRYRHGGLQASNPTVLLLLDGDEVYPLYARGRPEVTGVAAIDALMAKRDAIVERKLQRVAARAGLPFVILKRPGTGGSSGNQWRDGKTVQETALLDAALEALARRHGVARWAVASQSGGAAIAANLLARRHDIACAVLGSGPLALQAQLALQGADRALLHDLDDPIRHVDAIAADPYRRIFVLSDEADQLVPLAVQRRWVERASARGLAVEHLVRQGWGGGPLHHDLTWQAVDVASLCASDATIAEIATKTGGGVRPAVATVAQVTLGDG